MESLEESKHMADMAQTWKTKKKKNPEEMEFSPWRSPLMECDISL